MEATAATDLSKSVGASESSIETSTVSSSHDVAKIEGANTGAHPPTAPAFAPNPTSKPNSHISNNVINHEILTAEVQSSVKALKEACAKHDLKLRNDFEAVRLVVACEGNQDKMLKRIKHMREFEVENKFDEISPEEAWDYYHKNLPKAALTFIGHDRQERPVLYINVAGFYPSKIYKDPKLLRCLFRLCVFELQASATNLDEANKGFIMLMNCKGMAMKNFSLKLEHELSWLYQNGYPIRLCQIIFFNANAITRVVIKACKVFLTRKMQERIVIVNGNKEIQELVSTENLPKDDDLGSLSTAQSREISLKRVGELYAFESQFSLGL